MNTLNLSGLSEDKMFNPDQGDNRLSDSPQTENRWFVGFEHQGTVGRYLSTYVDFNKVSDDDYFYDFGGTGLNVASRNHLNQQGIVNFNSSLLQADSTFSESRSLTRSLTGKTSTSPMTGCPNFLLTPTPPYLWASSLLSKANSLLSTASSTKPD